MENAPALVDRLQELLQNHRILLFFAVHLTVGRTFSLIVGFLAGIPPLALIGLAWIGDMLNIPFFVTIYELGHRGLRLSPWIARKFDRGREYLERRRFYQKFRAMGALGVIVIAAIPLWGCGMWSAIFLAWSMKMNRLPGTLYLSMGSVIGSTVVLTLLLGIDMVLRVM